MVKISKRELELPDSVIGKLLELSSEHKDIISLSVGEPDFITPEPILKHVTKIIKKSTHYSAPGGRTDLKEAICKKLKKENKIKCNVDNVFVSAGSQEALFSAFLASLDPSEQVILSNPGYLGYIPAIELVNGVPVYVKLKEDEDFSINPDEVRKVVDKKKTRVILINTPSNPTGNVLSRKILEELADIAIDTDTYIFSDEAYEKLIYDKKHVSIGSLNGMDKHAVTFQSFSKSFAMCGFRLGYAVGNEKLIKAMENSSHYITLCPPHVSQFLGLKALSLSNRYVNNMRKEYDRRRRFIVKRLNDIGLRTRMPGGAFYTFSKINSKNSLKFANDLLKKKKVAVVPGTEFGRYGEGYIRCSYANDLKKIKIAMDRIEDFVE